MSFNKIGIISEKIYFKYLRFRISRIEKVKDIINIMNNICLFYGKLDNDRLTDIIYRCLTEYPLNENELQTFSTIQQDYDNTLGIENYASLLLWLSVIEATNIYPISG